MALRLSPAPTPAARSPSRHPRTGNGASGTVGNGTHGRHPAATSLAAELTGTLDQVGTVEVGKLADLVLVDGDPMYDIQALRNIWAVFQGGRRIR